MTRAYREPAPPPLGALVREHGWHMTSNLFVVAAFFILVPLAVVVFLPNKEPVSQWEPSALFGGAVMMLGMPALGVYMIVTAIKQRSSFVRLHERGFVHRWKGVESTVLYEDVDDITTRTVQTRMSSYDIHTIHTRRGAKLIVTHGYEDAARIAREVRDRVQRVKSERARI